MLSNDKQIRIGIMSINPDSTDAPLALVCRFTRPASPEVLLEAQRLAWNFSRSLLLITVEPTLIRRWSCYEKPVTAAEIFGPEYLNINAEALDSVETPQILPCIEFDTSLNAFRDAETASSLSWIDLFSGAFFAREAKRFKIEG